MALLAMEAAPAASILSALERFLAEHFATRRVQFFIVDYRLSVLRAVIDSNAPGVSVPYQVEGTDIGRVFASQEATVRPDGRGGVTVWLPVTVRSDRLGVLEVGLPGPPSPSQWTELSEVATALGHAVTVASRDTDLFERASRAERLSLAAEIQWQLLPGRGCAGPDFRLAGQLEPAYQVAGDNFDWCVSRDHVDLTVSDGMGRGVPAAVLTAVAVNALRNARRADLSLADQASMADQAIHGLYGGQHFVATLLLRFDRRRHRVTAIDAGSPLLLRQRSGGVGPIPLDKQLPLGMFEGTIYSEQEFDVVPGDRIVVVSDGIHRASPRGGDDFGDAKLHKVVRAVRRLQPGEAVRQIIRELLDHHGNEDLRDDAVAVVCDWVVP
jgi:serine phosphatase RsbU (regulator of sigma subunit)